METRIGRIFKTATTFPEGDGFVARFHVYSDSADMAIGAVLAQLDDWCEDEQIAAGMSCEFRAGPRKSIGGPLYVIEANCLVTLRSTCTECGAKLDAASERVVDGSILCAKCAQEAEEFDPVTRCVNCGHPALDRGDSAGILCAFCAGRSYD